VIPEIQVIPAQLDQSDIADNEDILGKQVQQVIQVKRVELVPRVTEAKPVQLVIQAIRAEPGKQAEPGVMVYAAIRVIPAQLVQMVHLE
jgi:hypothetical protein